MPMTQVRIFLADSQPVFREGLKAVIRKEAGLCLVGEAEDGLTAIREAIRIKPDVVIIDVSMPGLRGAETTQQLHENAPESRIIALTAQEDADFAKQLLEHGVAGFVCKRAPAQIVIDAIHAVAAGRVYVDPEIGSRMVQWHLRKGGNGCRAELSERELTVMRMISHGYSNKEIAARLEVSIKTIETYKSRSMEKLGLDSRVAIMRYAVEQGWLQHFAVCGQGEAACFTPI